MAGFRVRRPLLALVVLLVAIAVGYAVRAAGHDDGSPGPSPSPHTQSAPVRNLFGAPVVMVVTGTPDRKD